MQWRVALYWLDYTIFMQVVTVCINVWCLYIRRGTTLVFYMPTTLVYYMLTTLVYYMPICCVTSLVLQYLGKFFFFCNIIITHRWFEFICKTPTCFKITTYFIRWFQMLDADVLMTFWLKEKVSGWILTAITFVDPKYMI